MHYRPRYVRANPGPRVDEEITHERVTVIDETGKRLGQMPTVAAIQLARSRGFSLLELAPGVGRFGRAAKPSTVVRHTAPQESLLKLKEQFGTRLPIPEDTEQDFPYEHAPGEWIWIRLQPLEEHIKQILKIPQYTTDSSTVRLWDISRKVVDQKKKELLKEQTKKSDEIIALSKKLSELTGVKRELLTYFEDSQAPANKKNPALIALTVQARQDLASKHCGPTVCLGRYIGYDRKLAYIGMWWKNHVWAFVDPETQTGRQLNFKTRAPEFDEVVSYDNGPSYVTAEDEAQALEIARRWMPEARNIANNWQNIEETSTDLRGRWISALSAKLDKSEMELNRINYDLNQVRILEAYQTWRRSGKLIRLEQQETFNAFAHYPRKNQIIGLPDYLFMPAEERDWHNTLYYDEEVNDNSSLVIRYGLLTGRLEEVAPFVYQQVYTKAEQNFQKRAIHRMNVWHKLISQMYDMICECLVDLPREAHSYLQKFLRPTINLSFNRTHRLVDPESFIYRPYSEHINLILYIARQMPNLEEYLYKKKYKHLAIFGAQGRELRALMGIEPDGSSVLRDLTDADIDSLADNTFDALIEKRDPITRYYRDSEAIFTSLGADRGLKPHSWVQLSHHEQKQQMRAIFHRVYQTLREVIQTWAPYNDLPLFDHPDIVADRLMLNLRVDALKFYDLEKVSLPEIPLSTLRRIVLDRELEYLHGPYARAQLNPRTR